MIRQIDNINGHIVQKIITPKGKILGYQVVASGEHDASKVQRFAYLSTARLAALKAGSGSQASAALAR